MPDDVGGGPFANGREPDDDRGGADDDVASVVFDEDFVRAAEVHEPSAVERLLAAAQARAEAEAARARAGGGTGEEEPYDDAYGPDPYGRRDCGDGYDPLIHHDGPYGPYGGALWPYRPSARWHRPVAWVLAVVMGVGMVVLAFAAVHRGASGSRDDRIPAPATSGVDEPPAGPGRTTGAQPGTTGPTAHARYTAPPVPAVPRTP
ncbi:hypothetical protein ACLGI4_19880 [Streptomyces sp. HMX112]|uniref:SCO2584 family spore wall biosynthesis protein n=1 Tax=Streptomyces sp. HMX112 TaxID=3390850 RepID=UPI003A8136EA